MEVCRLCGAEKKPQDLVISLSEEIQIITFREFVEYYCRIELDQALNLPQKVCQSCKNSVVKFAEFSYIVDEQQKMFDIKPKLIELEEPEEKKPKIDESEAFAEYAGSNNNNINMESDPLAVLAEGSDKKSELLTEKLETENGNAKHSRLHLRRKSVLCRQSVESSLSNDRVSL
jgi:Zinc-finger associated domain (zf-AD)